MLGKGFSCLRAIPTPRRGAARPAKPEARGRRGVVDVSCAPRSISAAGVALRLPRRAWRIGELAAGRGASALRLVMLMPSSSQL